MELPLPAHDPAAGRGRAPGGRPRPRRLRAQRQADRSSSDYTYARHVAWMSALVFDRLDLRDITFFGQDWGGLIGLRLVAAQPDRYARVVIGNTGLPTGHGRAERGLPRVAEVLAGDAGLPGRQDRERRLRHRPRPRGHRRLRRTVPRRPLQGRRPHLPDARAHQRRRPGQRRQRAGLGGAVGVREAVRPRLQRPDPITEGRRRAVPGEGARAPRASRTRPSRAAATSSRRTSPTSWRRSSSTPSPRADVTTSATAHPPAPRPGRPGVGGARRVRRHLDLGAGRGRPLVVDGRPRWGDRGRPPDPDRAHDHRRDGRVVGPAEARSPTGSRACRRALRRVTNEWRLEPAGDRTRGHADHHRRRAGPARRSASSPGSSLRRMAKVSDGLLDGLADHVAQRVGGQP